MHIIPVIDLLNGTVVHAKKGIRADYHHIQSKLTDANHPIDIVKSFQRLYPFKTLYIADLNAIQQQENTGESHQKIIESIHQLFPALTIWIDAGINCIEKANPWTRQYTKLVLGSESFASIEQYQHLITKLTHPYLLSLDFSAQSYLGPKALLANHSMWPLETIVMTLSKVGANAGVDIQTIKNIISKSQQKHIYAAGGVRDVNDLIQLQNNRVTGALIASAFHHQQISSQDLTHLSSIKKPE